MIRVNMLLICALLLTSCATQMVYPYMVKDGATEQQRKTDAFECKTLAADFKSKQLGGGAPSFGVYGMAGHKKQVNEANDAANEYYVECMEVRGYKIYK
jgi:hypothetical protein